MAVYTKFAGWHVICVTDKEGASFSLAFLMTNIPACPLVITMWSSENKSLTNSFAKLGEEFCLYKVGELMSWCVSAPAGQNTLQVVE